MADAGVAKVERRAHPRIHVSTAIEISAPGAQPENGDMLDLMSGAGLTVLRAGTLIDLSREGARFRVGDGVGGVGEQLRIFLPAVRGGDVGLRAEIKREEVAEASRVVAVQFCHDDELTSGQLYDLLDLMLSSSDARQRTHARVAHRMLISYGPGDEKYAVLEDLSVDGLRMLCSEPFYAGDELVLTLPDSAGEALLTLRGKILTRRAVPGTAQQRYRLGVGFEDLSVERRRCLEALVECILAR